MSDKKQISINDLIFQLKHDYGKLPIPEGFSPSQFGKLVAGVLGFGLGMVGLYSILQKGGVKYSHVALPSQGLRSSAEKCYVAGLRNLGNNCFFNVIVQALASCSSFHSFLQMVLVSADPLGEENTERLPLAVSLCALLEELCITRDQRTVLNPQKVMYALSFYAKGFNLTRQQDAAEAFFHLLSSLAEEALQCYTPHKCLLEELSGSVSRIYVQKKEGVDDVERWHQHLIRPFDGIIGSILTCRSCSNMLSMNLEFFHCLPLSPMLDGSGDIMEGCTVVDCLKSYTEAEHIHDYHCDRCWHLAALNYLSLRMEKDKEHMKVLGQCAKPDSCDCSNLFLDGEIAWTGLSHAVKQSSITRFPRILCIHLLRSSIKPNGEMVKLQGHISFPPVLDLSQFVVGGARILGQGASLEVREEEKLLVPLASQFDMKWKMELLRPEEKVKGERGASEVFLRNKLGDLNETASGGCSRDIVLETKNLASYLQSSKGHSGPESTEKVQVAGLISSSSSKRCLYRLCSVVEHYGRPGSGHYAVYRRTGSQSGGGDFAGAGATRNGQWLYISDEKVSKVSQEDVFAAEASLLFYERIEMPL